MNQSRKQASYTLPHEPSVLAILRDFGVQRAWLFGSAARGELTPTSDIDVLVQMEGTPDYGVLLRLSEMLESTVGRPFDVVTSIKSAFRPYIETELVELPL